jgi:hypothetical protein
MNLKLDLTKAVKIVIAKDETHHVEYIIDNGEIKDVNIIEIDNSQVKNCEKKTIEFDPPVNNPEYNDRYFIDKAVPLAEKILSGRKMVATVQDGISDTSNPATLHEILNDGTNDGKETEEIKDFEKKWNKVQDNAVVMERSKKLIELVKNGDIDKRVKKQSEGGIPKIISNVFKEAE